MNDTAWYSDEGFWQTFYDCLFNADSFGRAAEEVQAIRELSGVESGLVLDMGAGPGRHAGALAAAGFDVTAVDLSAYLIARGRDYARATGVRVEWQQADMREFLRPDFYDLALSMWTSFGYFADPEDDLRVLKNLYRSLKPGGVLLLDMVGKEYLCRNLQPVHVRELDNGDVLMERPLLDRNMTRLSNEWTLITESGNHRARWSHNVYSGQELADRLRTAGFEQVRLYGNLKGDAYDLDAERLIAVASKGEP